ncbi:MAG: dihydropteroate synthase [Chloroflexi bacterium]|nr:dihydropteroate synthase [Chloroflexota bacterium]
MFVIANNITTRNSVVNQIFRQAKAGGWVKNQQAIIMLQDLTEQCITTGADALEINIQQYHDLPEAMKFAVNAVQETTNLQLCLSTNSAEALEAGLRACKRPPLINYISIDEAKLRQMLPLIANHGASVVLLVSTPTAPTDAHEMLRKTAILVGAANEVGIPNDSIFVDPGLIHITSDMGQRHLTEVMEFLRVLPDATEPPVKSTCWLANCSAGAPKRLRPAIETTLLPMLAGTGLSSVFLDVLQRENRRALRMIKIFNNEVIYSNSEAEL